MGREPGDGAQMQVTPQHLKPLPQAALPHYWHPQRDGVEAPPRDFAAKLHAVHPDLRLTMPPAQAPVPVRCWLLWVKQPRITHNLCPGWQLLMAWKLGNELLPLDERLFAAIYHFDARHMGSAVQYFDRYISEREKARAKEKAKYSDDLHYRTRDYYRTTKISSIGRGNRFALHHDGTIFPSRGESNWNRENERRMMPEAVRRERDATIPGHKK